jgi:hypothetical protein
MLKSLNPKLTNNDNLNNKIIDIINNKNIFDVIGE